MQFSRTFTRAQIGITAPPVAVEAHVTSGLPAILIVGLPETTVKESKDRVRAAIANSGFEALARKATVNLAPANLPKQGSRYDLAIAMTLIAASRNWPSDALDDYEFFGELGLDGSLRDPGGVLPAVIASARSRRTLIVPRVSGAEASLASHDHVRVADSLGELCKFLKGNGTLDLPDGFCSSPTTVEDRLDDIKGQQLAKRALVIAAAGGHNLLLIGPPGTGKTMLASRLASLLPPLTETEALEVASIRSISKWGFDPHTWGQRPFRNPHHTASAIALVGGGTPPRPGEISLAHNGVLFLDELPEFARSPLEVLREPLESGQIIISRANHQVCFPARFQLVAAMNPCPCGYLGDDPTRCNCPIDRVEKYRARVSGPLTDRIDLHVEVPRLPPGALGDPAKTSCAEHTEAVETIARARDRMEVRDGKLNAWLSSKEAARTCRLSQHDRKRLEDAMETLKLSARAYYKILKLARTIADIEDSEHIETNHLWEAIGYRTMDRYRETVE